MSANGDVVATYQNGNTPHRNGIHNTNTDDVTHTNGKLHNANGKNTTLDDEEHMISIGNRRCDVLRRCCHATAMPCWTIYNPLPSQPSRYDRVKYALMCPPHGNLARIVGIGLVVLLFWAAVWSLTGAHALPGGNFFGIILLVILAKLGGELVALVRLPPLLGMLIVGCLLRNIPYVNYGKDIDRMWASALRTIALCVILLRAGLGLDPQALKKTFGIAFRLAALPGWIEVVADAVVAHFLLGFPWIWAFVLGFVMSAVSPAVVVPSMISLQEKGLGVGQGIPTLLIAGCSLNDVVAISGFGIMLGIAFSKANLVLTILHGPLEALLGLSWGICYGIICWYIPHLKYASKTPIRFALLFLGGVFALFGSRAAHFPGAGALGTLIMAFVAGIGWRRNAEIKGKEPVRDILALMWMLFQPLLFGLIGNEIAIEKLDGSTVGMGVAMLFIGLLLRSVVAFFSAFGHTFTLKEKFFVAIAWLPKATVQAAIGPVALDTAREMGADAETISLAMTILAMAVLSILITAPLGAAAIALSAPRLLQQHPMEDENKNSDDSTKKEDIALLPH